MPDLCKVALVHPRRIFLITLLAVGGAAGWFQRNALLRWVDSVQRPFTISRSHRPKPDPAMYSALTASLETWRVRLAARLMEAKNPEERAKVLTDARIILETALPTMMRCWLGTPYDFNGTANAPGKGKIACGYFVATVLKDAGINVDRYQLAKQPSENILRSFLPKNACSLTVNQEYTDFATSLSRAEAGVYVVGLDTHVAFAVVRNGTFRVIHASGSRPWCVVDENASGAGVVRKSKWRLLGNMTANQDFLNDWLTAQRIVVRGA